MQLERFGLRIQTGLGLGLGGGGLGWGWGAEGPQTKIALSKMSRNDSRPFDFTNEKPALLRGPSRPTVLRLFEQTFP